jgi:hypothetical protein
MLTMKENVRIARHLPQRILHAIRTSTGCAAAGAEIPGTKSQTPSNYQISNIHKSENEHGDVSTFGFWSFLGIWNLGFGVSGVRRLGAPR